MFLIMHVLRHFKNENLHINLAHGMKQNIKDFQDFSGNLENSSFFSLFT